ncbi:hypothetical protein PR202_gb26922 [Eleusine coracana subsp. coracana]|uniref:Uncharacterized protein n=1 Tax=Eleusine coracana subsp. coracana TaxID=191504 RepID=A0AAV5FUI0_ELECO|nr:hypothetical protein PR202_gb26922 [Eleusine coracana subsp. coracana]
MLDRLSLKDNPFRCSYILPDGITYKKGYVKDMNEARKYSSLPVDGELERKDYDMDTNKSEDRKKPELSQNEFVLTNERFLVPEMIFHPNDIG